MTIALRPMSLGEILDRAVQMLKSNFALFAEIAAVPALATLAYSLASQQAMGRGSGEPLAWRMAGRLLTFAFWLALMILTPLAAGAKCWAASQVLLEKPVTVGSAYGRFGHRKGRLIGLGIMQGLLSFWPVIPVLILTAILAPKAGRGTLPALYGFVILLLLVPCAALYARYLLAYPATAIADSDVSDSLKRSVELGRGHRWKSLWAFLLPMGIGIAVVASGNVLIAWLGHAVPVLSHHRFLVAILLAVWTFGGSLFYGPLTSISVTLMYYDLCVRKEGFDIVQMIEQAGMESPRAETELA
jgi:hypothetical protein